MREPRLQGKVAIVTGAGTRSEVEGTGNAIAIAFAREGARVVVMDLSEDHAALTAHRIGAEGGDAMSIVGDVAKSADCQAAVAAALGSHGRLDIVVNNVGINRSASVVELDEVDWAAVLDTNLKGMALMTKHAIPAMEKSGGGVFVNISSVAAARGYGPTLAYTAAKGGVESMTRLVAVEHGRQSIRANCVAPGNIHAPLTAGGTSAEQRRFRRLSNPLGVEGTGWDVAQVALFLASDESRWVTGQVLTVDGGYSIATIAWHDRQRKIDDKELERC